MIILLIMQLICIITLCIISLVNNNRLRKQIEQIKSIQEDCSDNLEILIDIVMEELTNEQTGEK